MLQDAAIIETALKRFKTSRRPGLVALVRVTRQAGE